MTVQWGPVGNSFFAVAMSPVREDLMTLLGHVYMEVATASFSVSLTRMEPTATMIRLDAESRQLKVTCGQCGMHRRVYQPNVRRLLSRSLQRLVLHSEQPDGCSS